MGLSKVVGKDLIPVGLRNLTRMSATNERYLIYLPERLNNVWRAVYGRGIRVYVYVEIPEDLGGRQQAKSNAEADALAKVNDGTP